MGEGNNVETQAEYDREPSSSLFWGQKVAPRRSTGWSVSVSFLPEKLINSDICSLRRAIVFLSNGLSATSTAKVVNYNRNYSYCKSRSCCTVQQRRSVTPKQFCSYYYEAAISFLFETLLIFVVS